MKRWEAIAAVTAALQRLYPCGEDDRELTDEDRGDIENEVSLTVWPRWPPAPPEDAE